jgi:tRNA dimethylallyltransferase
VAETEALIQCYGAELPLLGTIGYAEARQRLAGSLSESEAVALTEQRTRQFAKRQRTWFRRRHQPTWLPGHNTADQLAQALQEVERVLG